MRDPAAPFGAPRHAPRARREKAHGLPRARRVRKHHMFQRIERQGMRAQGRFVVVVVRGTHGAAAGRVGFTVSKKVGGAVVRNLVKRRLRAIARMHKDALFVGQKGERDVVLIARPEAAEASYDALSADLLLALHNLAGAQRGPSMRRKP